jgi:polyisoprenoid-binding protein YceI
LIDQVKERPVVKRNFLYALSFALLLPALAAADPVTYKVDADHSGVGFSIRHFVSNVSGRFRDFDGVIKYDKANPAASSVEFTVKAASIDTSNNDRDEHLRSKDFFDVQKFPTLTFTSTKVVAKDANTLDVTGNLTMHGVTKPVTFPVTLLGTVKTPKGEKAGFETNFKVDRKEYGITWNNVLDSGPVLGDDVKVNIEIEANRQEAAPAKQ